MYQVSDRCMMLREKMVNQKSDMENYCLSRVVYFAIGGADASARGLSSPEIFAEGTGYTFALSGMNALSTDSSLRAGLLITPLLQSPEDALAAEKAGAHTLAIAVEEPVGDQITKLVWFTGANNFNSKEAVTQNMYLPLFGMHWAFETYTSQVGDIAPISYNTTFMNVSEMSAAWLSVLFIGVIPAAMVGAGILVFMKRRKI